MAQFRHFAVLGEAIDMVGEVADELKLQLIPNIAILEQPRIPIHSSFSPEVASSLVEHRHLFLAGAFTTHPVQFGQREDGSWYVDQMTAGPLLTWSLPSATPSTLPKHEGRLELGPGSMGYGQFFRNPLTKQWESPSEELKRAYASIVRIIKRRSVRVGRKNLYWIGRRTHELLDAKEVYMPLLRR